jgi:hypothetical protein
VGTQRAQPGNPARVPRSQAENLSWRDPGSCDLTLLPIKPTAFSTPVL